MTKFKDLFEAGKDKELDLLEKEIFKLAVVNSVLVIDGELYAELEGYNEKEYWDVQDLVDKLQDEGKIDSSWTVSPLNKKQLKKYAKHSYSDIMPYINDILDKNAIVKIYRY